MALPTASDNAFPSLLVTEGSAPSSPAAGKQRLFVDSSDHLLKLKNSSGTVSSIGGGLSDPMTTRGDIIVRNASNVTARLAIGSSGKVLSSDGTDISWQTPSGGGFVGCKAYATTTQGSIAATTMTKVNFNNEEFDTSSFHDNVTNNTRLTVPSTGYYLLMAYLYGGTTGSRVVLANFFKNNTTVIRGQIHYDTIGNAIGVDLVGLASLTAADYVELRVWCSTSDLTLGDATNIEQQCWFSAQYLGA